jgi:hypothetical protein
MKTLFVTTMPIFGIVVTNSGALPPPDTAMDRIMRSGMQEYPAPPSDALHPPPHGAAPVAFHSWDEEMLPESVNPDGEAASALREPVSHRVHRIGSSGDARPAVEYPTLDDNRTAGPYYPADVAEEVLLSSEDAQEFIDNSTASLREDQENVSPAYAATADVSSRVAGSLHARRQRFEEEKDVPREKMLQEQERLEEQSLKRRAVEEAEQQDEDDTKAYSSSLASRQRSLKRSKRQIGTGESHGGGLEQQHRQALREHEAALRALERLQQTGAGERLVFMKRNVRY